MECHNSESQKQLIPIYYMRYTGSQIKLPLYKGVNVIYQEEAIMLFREYFFAFEKLGNGNFIIINIQENEFILQNSSSILLIFKQKDENYELRPGKSAQIPIPNIYNCKLWIEHQLFRMMHFIFFEKVNSENIFYEIPPFVFETPVASMETILYSPLENSKLLSEESKCRGESNTGIYQNSDELNFRQDRSPTIHKESCLKNIELKEDLENKNKEKESKITHTTLASYDDISLCSICFDEIKQKGEISCNHKFCYPCILKWALNECTSCPLCRKQFSAILHDSPTPLSSKFTNQAFTPSFPVTDSQMNPISNEEKKKNKKIQQVKPRMRNITPMTFNEEFSETEAESLDNLICYSCQEDKDDNLLLICDHCSERASHTYCDNLIQIPTGSWYCNFCRQELLTSQQSLISRESILSTIENSDPNVDSSRSSHKRIKKITEYKRKFGNKLNSIEQNKKRVDLNENSSLIPVSSNQGFLQMPNNDIKNAVVSSFCLDFTRFQV